MMQICVQWTLSTTGRRYFWNDVSYKIYFLFLKWTQIQTTKRQFSFSMFSSFGRNKFSYIWLLERVSDFKLFLPKTISGEKWRKDKQCKNNYTLIKHPNQTFNGDKSKKRQESVPSNVNAKRLPNHQGIQNM